MGTNTPRRPDPESALRRGAERSLRASEELFTLLVSSVRDYSIYVLDPDGLIVTWNDGARHIKGYEAAEIIGRHYSQFFTDEDRAAGRPKQLLAEATRAGLAMDQGWRVRKNGTRFWASSTLTALRDEDGELRGFAKVTHDDTERHTTAEALRASEERFRLAVGSLREHALYMLDPQGIVQSWNPGAERHKGWKAEEIIGQHFSVFFAEDDRVSGKPMRELAVAAQTGSFEEEGWRVRKDGTRFWAAVVVTAVRDATGSLRGFVKVTRDETAKHEADLQLQQALDRAQSAEAKLRGHAAELERRVEERTALLAAQAETLKRTNSELEQFAYIASHDLKEPLRMISSYLDLLRTRYAPLFDGRANGYFDRILAAAERMRVLVEAVLEYSRYDSSADTLEPVPLRQAVEAALADLAPAVAESGARIDIAPLPTVRANRTHLARVFLNLLANALKFRSVERRPEIRVSAREIAEGWEVAIADNGIGIPPELQERLFRIFQRLHTLEEYPGSGIGLATCKKIVELHGGRIWVESVPGEGSTFRFTLRRD